MRLEDYISESVDIIVKKPADCTPEERKKFVDLVVSGGQNISSYVRSAFRNLVWVGFAYVDGEIKAVSSIKKGFVDDTFEAAGVEEVADDFSYEMGFSFTEEGSRKLGYSNQIKKELLKRVGNKGVYSTVRTNNKASIIAIKKLGFEPLGEPYQGLLGDYTVQLMVLGKK